MDIFNTLDRRLRRAEGHPSMRECKDVKGNFASYTPDRLATIGEWRKCTLFKSLLSLFRYLLQLFRIFLKYTEGSKNSNLEQFVKFV